MEQKTMKLKTLKEIYELQYSMHDVSQFAAEVRQEAIKWLQHIDEVWEGNCMAATAFIMDFFNLEPEDLDEGKDVEDD